MYGRQHEELHVRAMRAAVRYLDWFPNRILCGDHYGHVVFEEFGQLVLAQVIISDEIAIGGGKRAVDGFIGMEDGFDDAAFTRAACEWMVEHERECRKPRADSIAMVRVSENQASVRHIRDVKGLVG